MKARASDADADWAAAFGWVAEDPAHGVAFAKVEAAWDIAARLRELPRQAEEALSAPEAEVAIAPAPATDVPVSLRRAFAFSPRIVFAALAACILAIVGVVALQLDATVDRYRTGVGGRRAIRLADGSVIRLNTASSVEVAFGEDRRVVRLLRGEGSFDVARDATRPFIVTAHGAMVRAVGTAFTVRLRADLTEVTVTHGVVTVRDGGTAERRVGAGRAAALREGAVAITPLAAGELTRRLAWQQGRLSFDGDTLAQAVEEFNRYRATPIVIGDPALAGVRIGGTFRADRSEDFAGALEQSFGIRAVAGKDGSLLLVPNDR